MPQRTDQNQVIPFAKQWAELGLRLQCSLNTSDSDLWRPSGQELEMWLRVKAPALQDTQACTLPGRITSTAIVIRSTSVTFRAHKYSKAP